MIKYICDSCGKELYNTKEIALFQSTIYQATIQNKHFHLCPDCMQKAWDAIEIVLPRLSHLKDKKP